MDEEKQEITEIDTKKTGLLHTERPNIPKLIEDYARYRDSDDRDDTFRILDGNKTASARKLGGLGRFFKRKKASIDAKTELYEVENIHLDGEKNAVYLKGALHDKFNLIVDADREYVKGYDTTKVITIIYPDGHQSKGTLTAPFIPDNIRVPKINFSKDKLKPEDEELTAEDLKLGAYELEKARVRLVQDDGTRTELYVDDRQVKLMALVGIGCLFGGFAFGLLAMIWVKSMGLI